jgi:hypothetical protein
METRSPASPIVRRRLTIVPPLYLPEKQTLVAVGLHALARHYERGERSEAAVLRDLAPLLSAYPKALETARADFPVTTASGGHWRCWLRTGNDGQRVIDVRTFIEG